MRFPFVRGFAAIGILALAACGGRGMVPMQSGAVPQAMSPVMADAQAMRSLPITFGAELMPNASSPCKQLAGDGVWYFKGPCLAGNISKKGTEFKLKAYKGVTQDVTFPSSNAKANSTFVVGEGTSKSDITGTFNKSPFPFYAAKGVPCQNTSYKTTPCVGKAFVYDLIVNASKNDVTFAGSPQFTEIDGKAIKGKKQCVLNELLELSSGGWAYLETPVTGKPKGTKVTLPSLKGGFKISGQSLSVFAVSCK